MDTLNKENVSIALKAVKDPELHVDIVTLGLVYGIEIGEDGIDVLMTLTTPFCPYGDEIIQNVEKTLTKKFGVEVRVDITFEPEWQPSEDLKIELGLP